MCALGSQRNEGKKKSAKQTSKLLPSREPESTEQHRLRLSVYSAFQPQLAGGVKALRRSTGGRWLLRRPRPQLHHCSYATSLSTHVHVSIGVTFTATHLFTTVWIILVKVTGQKRQILLKLSTILTFITTRTNNNVEQQWGKLAHDGFGATLPCS